jgi:hypothetical protein
MWLRIGACGGLLDVIRYSSSLNCYINLRQILVIHGSNLDTVINYNDINKFTQGLRCLLRQKKTF